MKQQPVIRTTDIRGVRKNQRSTIEKNNNITKGNLPGVYVEVCKPKAWRKGTTVVR